jgi:hypothetical protein
MGISRMAIWLVDQYSFFMPLAAGIEEKHATEKRILPLFNTKIDNKKSILNYG